MALAANTNLNFGEVGINSLPVKASAIIFKGSVVGLTAGYARPLTAGDQFGGFALEAVTGTTDGALRVAVQTAGLVQVAITSAAVTDVGLPVYASDDGTFTLTQSTNSPIGRVHRWVSTGIVIIAFNADFAQRVSGITVITDSTGGSASGNTIDDATSSVKDDLACLARKINEIIAILK